MKPNIRLLYLYLFSFVGLLIAVIGCVRLVDLGMKIFIFPDADNMMTAYAPKLVAPPGAPPLDPEAQTREDAQLKEENQKERTRQRQRETTGSLSMILVGFPLYLYHWKTIQREHQQDKTSAP